MIGLQRHRTFLEMACEEGETALQEGTYPIGAVLVGPDGEIMARGRNRVMTRGDITAHAEIDVIRQAGLRLAEAPFKLGCTLYTSVEPCLMCAGAVLFADVARVVWAMNDDWAGGIRRMMGGPYRPQKFARLAVLAAPFPDLDRQQRERMAAFDALRGMNYMDWVKNVPV